MTEVGSVAQWLVTYGHIIIFPLTLIEGNAVAMTAGFLASLGYFNVFYVGIIFILADFTSDIALYYAGSTGHSTLMRMKRVRRTLRRLEKQADQDTTLVGTFYTHFEKIFALSKILPIPQLPTAILLAAGFFNVSVKRVLITFAIIEPIKAFIYIGFGYFIGLNIFQAGFFGSQLSIVLIIIVIVVSGLIIWGRHYLLKQEEVSRLLKNSNND